ncbi:MAG: FtsX-like permease family protein [Christensenella sp.]|nr:FtsX-like permease family protein [Christensenella sp.]
MLCKIAFRNVKKSFGDYTIYFVTLMFAVMFFYAFNSLDAQRAIMDLNASKTNAAQMMISCIDIFSVFVAITLGILILYANNFLIRRRNKELGLYLVLGMGKGKVSLIFMLETLFVGIAALAAGLALGVLFSQGMSLITANLFEVQLKTYSFVFSPTAAIRAVIYFGIIFLCVMIWNAISISRQKIISLLYSDVRNEKMMNGKLIKPVIFSAVGLVLIIVAYYLIIKGMLLVYLPFVMLTGIPGTFLLFAGLAGISFSIVSHNKKRYFKGLNVFVTRQLTSKINSTHASMALVCIMLFVSIVTLGASSGVSAAVNKESAREIKYDAEFCITEDAISQSGSGVAALKEYGLQPSQYFEKTAEYPRYDSDVDVLEQFGDYLDAAQQKDMVANGNASTLYATAVPVSAFDDFLDMVGEKEISLSEGEVGIVVSNQSMKEKIEKFAEDQNKVLSRGEEYTIPKNQIRSVSTNISEAAFSSPVIIVYPDGDISGFSYLDTMLNGVYPKDGSTEAAMVSLINTLNENEDSDLPFNFYTTKTMSQDSSIGLRVTISFVGLYLGITFLVTAAVILALQQLSAANDNRKRYQILRQLGVERKKVNHALLKQIVIYFTVPLIIAAIHAIFGIYGLMSMISMMWYGNVYNEVFLGLGLIALIYGLYFIVTYFSSRKIIKE